MILVSLFGEFYSSIFPIFFEFKDKLTHHIIVYDEELHNEKNINKIFEVQIKYKYKKSFKYELSKIPINGNCYESILEASRTILSYASVSNKILLNTTDGLSSSTMILSNQILKANGKLISYDRYANTYNLITKKSIKKKKIKHNIDIENHLKFKGYNISASVSQRELCENKEVIYEIAKKLNSTNYRDINIECNKKLSKYNPGRLFEEYIYWLIKDNFIVDDIKTGITIEHSKQVINEIDILIMDNNHLHTIECKFTSSFNINEYLYKTDYVRDLLDDDNKGMILTVSDKKAQPEHFARAKFDNINFYASQEFDSIHFLEVVEEFFKLKRSK